MARCSASRVTATGGAAVTSSGTNPSHGNVHGWTASPSRSPGPRPRPRVDERDISASQREVPDQVVLADARERPQLVQLLIREQARRHRHHPTQNRANGSNSSGKRSNKPTPTPAFSAGQSYPLFSCYYYRDPQKSHSSGELKGLHDEPRGLRALSVVPALGFAGTGGVLLPGPGGEEQAGVLGVADGSLGVETEHRCQVQRVGSVGEGFLELPGRRAAGALHRLQPRLGFVDAPRRRQPGQLRPDPPPGRRLRCRDTAAARRIHVVPETPGRPSDTSAARSASGRATPTTRSGHADHPPPVPAFRKLDTVAVRTARLLPAPRKSSCTRSPGSYDVRDTGSAGRYNGRSCASATPAPSQAPVSPTPTPTAVDPLPRHLKLVSGTGRKQANPDLGPPAHVGKQADRSPNRANRMM